MDQALFVKESLTSTVTTVEAMKVANKQMKQEFKKIDISKVERLQDDMFDMMEQANEIQEALSVNYGLPDDIDEADLEAELDALGEEGLFDAEATPSYLEETVPQFAEATPSAPVQPEGKNAIPETI